MSGNKVQLAFDILVHPEVVGKYFFMNLAYCCVETRALPTFFATKPAAHNCTKYYTVWIFIYVVALKLQ